ncbi:unnamed protein product [Peniophora sp. CBMAI 1063]|nr:unnamed protein product [Peniophora sp. CBMAI 1063]
MSTAATAATAIPDIKWDKARIQLLLSESEVEENRKVLYGKQHGENSSAGSKAAVGKRMAMKVAPEVYAQNATVAGKRVLGKWNSLNGIYKSQAALLHQTGGGLHDGQVLALPLITGDAPDDETTPEGRNLWDNIVSNYFWFPTFWRLKHERPNTIPPAVHTGIGPQGAYTTYYQVGPPGPSSAQPRDPNIDPELYNHQGVTAPQPAPTPSSQPAPAAAPAAAPAPNPPAAA